MLISLLAKTQRLLMFTRPRTTVVQSFSHDRVRERGVPTKLIADNSPMYRGWNVANYLQDLVVSMWQCDTKYQSQNTAENRYQTVKRHTDRTMDRRGAPAAAWFLCLVYICLCLNNCVDPKFGDGTESPIMMSCFAHNDISILLNFYFWQPVHYLLDPTDQSFGVKSKEKRARWAGVDESIGAKMCYKLVDDESGKIICRSAIRSATEPGTANLRVNPIESLPSDADAILDEMMSTADFETPLSNVDPVDLIPASTKSKTWQEMEQDNQLEH